METASMDHGGGNFPDQNGTHMAPPHSPYLQNEKIAEPERPSADEMDQKRKEQIAFEYLCRMEEAKTWMEECLNDSLPASSELDEKLRNGVLLARISHFFAPTVVPESKIFDPKEERYTNTGLHFRHTDNTMQWIRAMRSMNFPEVFIPDTTDVYDKKNMPKAVFCIHALSLYLYRKGLAPPIRDVSGNVAFTKEEINVVAAALAEQGIKLPPFSKIGGILAEELSKDEAEMHAAVVAINDAIEKNDPNVTLAALQNPVAQLNFVTPSRASLYQDSLLESKTVKSNEKSQRSQDSAMVEDMYDGLLTHNEIQKIISSVNENDAMVNLNETLEKGDEEALLKALLDPQMCFPRITPQALPLYLEELRELRAEKGGKLTYQDVFGAVKVINAVVEVNHAVSSGDVPYLEKALGSQQLHLEEVDPINTPQYLTTLKAIKDEKEEKKVPCPFLRHTEIQESIRLANKPLSEEDRRAEILVQMTHSLKSDDSTLLLEFFKDLKDNLSGVQNEHSPLYWHILSQKQKEREAAGELLTLQDIQDAIDEANLEIEKSKSAFVAASEINRALDSKASDNVLYEKLETHMAIIGVEPEPVNAAEYRRRLEHRRDAKLRVNPAYANIIEHRTPSGYILYSDISEPAKEIRFETQQSQPMQSSNLTVPEIGNEIKFSNDMSKYFEENREKIIKIQAQARMRNQQRRYNERLKYLKAQESSARKIQEFMRTKQSVKDYQALMNSDAPTLDLVRKFADLVIRTEVDYDEEIEVQSIRTNITQEVRANQKLEEDLNVMDLKIGLLVKNCLDLEEVMRHSQKLKSQEKDLEKKEGRSPRKSAKTGKGKVEFYQRLLYILQTDPQYLSYLLLSLTAPKKLERLVDCVIFPLFGYGSQRREEYLWSKFLHRVINEECRLNLGDIKEVFEERLTAPRMAVHFSRHNQGEALKDILNPMAKDLLAEQDKSIHINTDPLEIYKYLVGDPPAHMTDLEASKHPEVASILEISMKYIDGYARKYFEAITKSVEPVPYVVRYAAKVLTKAIRAKLTDVPERQVMKAVSSFVYSQYLKHSISSPDISVLKSKGKSHDLTLEQKKTFASIAKLLQFATSNKGFGEDTAYLAPLNETIKQFHDGFRNYFTQLISVPEPEDFYGMDQFSEYTVYRRPLVVMTVGDIHFLQELLLERRKTISPDPHDLLRQTLDILGHASLEEVANSLADTNGTVDIGSISVTLLLKGKPKPPTEDPQLEMKHLFLTTKRLLLDVILSQKGKNIPELLSRPATQEEEDEHWKLKDRFQQPGSRKSVMDSDLYSLEEKKELISQNLERLEKEGLVRKEDGYQALINAIASDVKQESKERNRRRNALKRLDENYNQILAKRQYYIEQIDTYDKYIEGVLQQMDPKQKRGSIISDKQEKKPTIGKENSRQAVKYGGDKLAKKNVLLDVKGFNPNQLKTINFEFVQGDKPGVFIVNIRFPDKTEEHPQIALQDLLKSQYEGEEVLKLIHKVKLSVPHLVLLINKKFYCT